MNLLCWELEKIFTGPKCKLQFTFSGSAESYIYDTYNSNEERYNKNLQQTANNTLD